MSVQNKTVESANESQKLKWPPNPAAIGLNAEEINTLEGLVKKHLLNLASASKNSDVSISITRQSSCPRRLEIYQDHAFVVLNRHGGISVFNQSGSQQENIKYVWDCVTGSVWLKKKLASQKQVDGICFLKYGEKVGTSFLGVPDLAIDGHSLSRNKFQCFEKWASANLSQKLRSGDVKLCKSYIDGLIDALKKIHSTKYQPAGFYSGSPRSRQYSSGFSHNFFHGDISPNNIICEDVLVEQNGKYYTRFMLTDFYGLGDLKTLVWSRGWGSPECIAFSEGKKYKDLSSMEFLAKYGAKKDSWAFGLLLGSILRGGLSPDSKFSLPCFSFIVDKLKPKLDAKDQKKLDEIKFLIEAFRPAEGLFECVHSLNDIIGSPDELVEDEVKGVIENLDKQTLEKLTVVMENLDKQGMGIGSLDKLNVERMKLLDKLRGIEGRARLDYQDQLDIANAKSIEIDESGLVDITQEEVDEKIDSIIDEQTDPLRKNFWGLVRDLLRVDPEKRPTLADVSRSIS